MLVLMKIFLVSFFIFIGFIFPSASFASHIELSECIEIAHCVREEWEVDSIEQPFKEVKEIMSVRLTLLMLGRGVSNKKRTL